MFRTVSSIWDSTLDNCLSSTNISFDEMMSNPDIRYRRIYDRILEHCIPVEMPGKSLRIIRAAQRQRALQDYYNE